MKCPNCTKDMKNSNIVIDTLPETRHTYCECGLVLDHYDGKTKVCFQSRLPEETKEAIRIKLEAAPK